MDPEDISRLVKEMNLSTPRPNETLALNAAEAQLGAARIANILVAKVLSPKAINREAFRQQMPRILQANRRINIEARGDNTIVCEFTSAQDQKRALEDGPWNFFRSLVIFRKTSGWEIPTTMPFDDFTIWVQCHNLPLALMQKELLYKVGRQIGEVVELDNGDNGALLGRFIRIRVRLNVNEPLSKFIRINIMGEEEDTIVLLVYERLPDFCYACGRVGHTVKDCIDETVNKANLGFGTWLRAATHAGGGKGIKPQELKLNQDRNHDHSNVEEIGQIKPSSDHQEPVNQAVTNMDDFAPQTRDIHTNQISKPSSSLEPTPAAEPLLVVVQVTDVIPTNLNSPQCHILTKEQRSTEGSIPDADHTRKHTQWKRQARAVGMDKMKMEAAALKGSEKRKFCSDEDMHTPKDCMVSTTKRAKIDIDDVIEDELTAVVAVQHRRNL